MTSMTLQDLITSLKLLDEVTLVEVLDLHTDEIIDRCMDIIEARFDELQYKIEDPRQIEETHERRQELTGNLSWETSDQETLGFEDYD